MHPRDHYRPTCISARIGVSGSKLKTLTSPLAKLDGYSDSSGNPYVRKRRNHMKIWLQEIKRGTRLKRQNMNDIRTAAVIIIFPLVTQLLFLCLFTSFPTSFNVRFIMHSLNSFLRKCEKDSFHFSSWPSCVVSLTPCGGAQARPFSFSSLFLLFFFFFVYVCRVYILSASVSADLGAFPLRLYYYMLEFVE